MELGLNGDTMAYITNQSIREVVLPLICHGLSQSMVGIHIDQPGLYME